MVAYYQLKGNSAKGFFLMLLFQQLPDLHNHWTNSTRKKLKRLLLHQTSPRLIEFTFLKALFMSIDLITQMAWRI